MGRLGIWEILVIGLVIVLLFGTKKLPEIASALGKALKDFRNAAKDTLENKNDSNENKV